MQGREVARRAGRVGPAERGRRMQSEEGAGRMQSEEGARLHAERGRPKVHAVRAGSHPHGTMLQCALVKRHERCWWIVNVPSAAPFVVPCCSASHVAGVCHERRSRTGMPPAEQGRFSAVQDPPGIARIGGYSFCGNLRAALRPPRTNPIPLSAERCGSTLFLVYTLHRAFQYTV